MLREIGSTFWDIETCDDCLELPEGGIGRYYLLSGRTAQDLIIRDIKKNRAFNSVYMPSYCCPSMIEPFLSNRIDVSFYDVVPGRNGDYELRADVYKKCDAVFIMQYFGFCSENADAVASAFKKSGTTVIEDITHSIFTGRPYSVFSDYVFASFRKWSGFPAGAVALKMNDRFSVPEPEVTNEKYITLHKKSKSLKNRYIMDLVGSGDRTEYLELNRSAEELLDKDYRNYTVTGEIKKAIKNLDVARIKKQRQTNTRILIDSIKYDTVDLVFNAVTDDDCPLYVPVIVKNGKRDEFKKFLSEKLIYCPSHWSLSGMHRVSEAAGYLYDNSLSVVCDQRYGANDMERIIKAFDAYDNIMKGA